MRYEALGAARYSVEHEGAREWIRIPAQRNWLVLLFLGFWLSMWTLGGIMAIGALITDFNLFLIVWLGGWAVGWLFAAGTIAWQLGGAELIEVTGGDLIHTVRVPLYRRVRAYRGGDVRDLRAPPLPSLPWGMNAYRGSYPAFMNFSAGSVTFRYGQRTRSLAPGLDTAEGQGIVDWLTPRLPRMATE